MGQRDTTLDAGDVHRGGKSMCNCRVPDDYIGIKIGSLLRAREIMELLVSTSVPENTQ